MLLIREDESKRKIAFLVEYDLEKNLDEVRTQVREELNGFVVDFMFVVFGCPITKLQESKYPLKHCVTHSGEDGFRFEISIKTTKTAEISLGEDIEVQCKFASEQAEQETSHVSEAASVCQTEFCKENMKEIPAAKNDIKDKNSDDILKKTKDSKSRIKRYTNNEFENCSSLFEKERRIFWNKKADEVEKDDALRDWGTQALNGVIDVAWTMKKTELLRIHVQKNEALHLQIFENTTVGKSMMSNLDRVEKTHDAVNRTYKFLCEEVVANKISQKELEQKMDEKFTELKKAQADLVKSCEQFYLKCTRDGELGGDAKSEGEIKTLNEAELEELVNDVSMVDYEYFSE